MDDLIDLVSESSEDVRVKKQSPKKSVLKSGVKRKFNEEEEYSEVRCFY